MKKCLLLLIFLGLGSQLSAQKVIVKKRKAGDPKVENEYLDTTPSYIPNNAVKFNLFTMFIGEFPVSYERKVTDWFSAEAGVGLLTKNYISDWIFEEPFGLAGDDLNTCSCDYEGKSTASLFLKAKFFPDEEVFDGSYYSLSLNYRPYTGDVAVDGGTMEWNYHATDLGFNFGGQYDHGNRLLSEFYIGAAIRFVEIDYPLELYDSNIDEYYFESASASESSFWINFGYQLGFLW